MKKYCNTCQEITTFRHKMGGMVCNQCNTIASHTEDYLSALDYEHETE